MTFRDHFSPVAGGYALHRPDYPAALYDALVALAPGHKRAWDCGTGNGQAAVALSRHFDHVVASDASATQLAEAAAAPGVDYVRASASASPIRGRSIDLVTVAQALHWFDLDAFFGECRRVLVRGGVLAAWGYTLLHVTPEVDALIEEFAYVTVGPWWPPERKLIDTGYMTVAFPFEPAPLPPFFIERVTSADAILGYLGTWSATLRCRQATGEDPVAAIAPRLREAWGPDPRVARWPLFVHAGVVVS